MTNIRRFINSRNAALLTFIGCISFGSLRQKAFSSAPFPVHKLQQPSLIDKPLVVLVACGSYSPITYLHLRIFEQARDYLMSETGKYNVIGGVISPVHDAYGKSSLVAGHHRLEMCKRAVQDSDWIVTSPWEIEQSQWTRTAHVLKHYQNQLNDSKLFPSPIIVKLICGADLLESCLIPGVWKIEDLDFILGKMGVTVIERSGLNVRSLIDDNPILAKYKDTIDVVPQRFSNTISSTLVRQSLREHLSVKYLTPDAVIKYIYDNNLYGAVLTPSRALGVKDSYPP